MISKYKFEHLMLETEYGFKGSLNITCPSCLGDEFGEFENCDLSCKDCWKGTLKDFNWEGKECQGINKK